MLMYVVDNWYLFALVMAVCANYSYADMKVLSFVVLIVSSMELGLLQVLYEIKSTYAYWYLIWSFTAATVCVFIVLHKKMVGTSYVIQELLILFSMVLFVILQLSMQTQYVLFKEVSAATVYYGYTTIGIQIFILCVLFSRRVGQLIKKLRRAVHGRIIHFLLHRWGLGTS